jgi:hypothetical protein
MLNAILRNNILLWIKNSRRGLRKGVQICLTFFTYFEFGLFRLVEFSMALPSFSSSFIDVILLFTNLLYYLIFITMLVLVEIIRDLRIMLHVFR